MHFLVRYGEHEGSGETRARLRDDHVAFRRSLGGSMLMAGALMTDDGAKTIGSLMLIETDNRDQAQEIALRDPFVSGGVLKLDSITAYRIAVMRPLASAQ